MAEKSYRLAVIFIAIEVWHKTQEFNHKENIMKTEQPFSGPNNESTDFVKLQNDPTAGPILEKLALEYFKTENREYFDRHFTGELDEHGLLIRKDGKAATKPSMAIIRKSVIKKLIEMVKIELSDTEIKAGPEQQLQNEVAVTSAESGDRSQNTELKIKTEKEALNSVRENLGLPPTDTSAAIEHLKNKHEQLKQDKTEEEKKKHEDVRAKIEEKRQEEIAAQERHSVKRDLQNVEDGFLRLSRIFQRREQDNLSVFLRREDYSRISSAARSLSENIQTDKINYEGIAKAIRSIHRAFETYGAHPSRGQIRENTDSLSAISGALRSAGESLKGLRRTLAKNEQNEVRDVVSAINTLDRRLEQIWHFNARKREILSRR